MYCLFKYKDINNDFVIRKPLHDCIGQGGEDSLKLRNKVGDFLCIVVTVNKSHND